MKKKRSDFEKNITSYMKTTEDSIDKMNLEKEKYNMTNFKSSIELEVSMKKKLMDFIDTHANNINVTIIPIFTNEKFIDRENFIFKNENEVTYKKPIGYFMISALFGVNNISFFIFFLFNYLNF